MSVTARAFWLHDSSDLGEWRFSALPRIGETIVLPLQDREIYRVDGVEHAPDSVANPVIEPRITLYLTYLGDAD